MMGEQNEHVWMNNALGCMRGTTLRLGIQCSFNLVELHPLSVRSILFSVLKTGNRGGGTVQWIIGT